MLLITGILYGMWHISEGPMKHFSIHLKYFLNYVASQSALLSPLVFLLVLGAWVLVLLKGYRRLEWIYLYLALTSLPMVTGFALLSLHTRVYGNWPSAGYFTAAILVAALFGGNSQKVLKKTKPSIGLENLAVGCWFIICHYRVYPDPGGMANFSNTDKMGSDDK